jgi:hypothetical protein
MDNGLSFGYDFLFKCVWVVRFDSLDGGKNIIVMETIIFAVGTCAAFTLFSRRKTITIHLKASTLFALAGDLVRIRSLALTNLRSRWWRC